MTLGVSFVSHLVQRSQVGDKPGQSARKMILKTTAIALVISIFSFCICEGSLRILCRAISIDYRSRLGFAYLWRLRFLEQLSAAQRGAFLNDAAMKANSSDVKSMIAFLRDAITPSDSWPIIPILIAAQQKLVPADSVDADAKLDEILNQMAVTIMLRQNSLLVDEEIKDLRRATTTTPNEIVRSLLQHTTAYFAHPSDMPQLANLVTFRNNSAQAILQFARHRYFRAARLSYSGLLLLWLATLFLYWRKVGADGFYNYALSLTCSGFLATLVTCFVTEFQYRYTLPLWELTVISETLLLGRLTPAIGYLEKDSLVHSRAVPSGTFGPPRPGGNAKK